MLSVHTEIGGGKGTDFSEARRERGSTGVRLVGTCQEVAVVEVRDSTGMVESLAV